MFYIFSNSMKNVLLSYSMSETKARLMAIKYKGYYTTKFDATQAELEAIELCELERSIDRSEAKFCQ